MSDDSTRTPFIRRFFFDEKRHEDEQTLALYEIVATLYARVGVDAESFTSRVISSFARHAPAGFSEHYAEAFAGAIYRLIQGEPYLSAPRPPSLSTMMLSEAADYRNQLLNQQRFLNDRDRTLYLLEEFLVSLFVYLATGLPDARQDSPFEEPLIHALPKPKAVVHTIFDAFAQEPYRQLGLLHGTREVLADNIYRVSGLDRLDPKGGKRFKEPIDSDLPPHDLADEYLAGTVFHDLMRVRVPLPFTHQDRFAHMHVLGGVGAGKTTLLENMVLCDLMDDNPPSLVIIDSQGDLIRKLSRIALWKVRDDLILISPKDIDYPPAINIFDVNRERLGRYDQATKEQVMAGVIETFDYLFTGLLGAELTAKQEVFFKHIARLMLSLPDAGVLEGDSLVRRNATILDMIRLMENPAPYRAAIESLPPVARSFLEDALLKNAKGQDNKTFSQTRDQIRYRLHAVIENPTLQRLFTTPMTKIDLFAELNKPGKVILVDTAKDFLKDTGSANFGRIFISLVLQAILERAVIPERNRTPTFLYVDEAHEYFSDNINSLLEQARKYRLGCILAHHDLDQASHGLRSSLAANTAIKFASGISASDARAMAPDMRTTADFILSQSRLHFAAYVKNTTQHPVSIAVQVGMLDKAPQLSDAEYEALLARNRARVSYRPEESKRVSPTSDEDVSAKW